EEKQKWKNFIFQKLNSPDRMVVFYSLLILEYWAAKGDLENLKPFIHSSDEDFRDQMVSILVRIPGPLSQKYLFQLTMDSSRKIRDRAWMALGKKKVLEAISPLKEIVKNPKSPLRLDALEILCHYHHPSLISFFEEVLLDPQGEYRSLPFQGGYIMEKEFKFLALKGLEAFPNYPTSSIKQILVYPGSAKVRKKALEILWKREGTPKTAQIIENLRTHSSPTVRRYGKELCQVLQNLEKKKKKN
ncbi:MAG: HEAT repeat domain-containing protein, partial [Planctomycetota bacterium]